MNQGNAEQVQPQEEQQYYEGDMTDIQPPPKFDLFQCPECGIAFNKSRWLGAHRYRAHGVKGLKSQGKTKWKPTPEQRRAYATTAKIKYRARKKVEEAQGLAEVDKNSKQEEGEISHVGQSNNESNARARHLAYAFGHVEAWVGIYADSIGVPRAEFAQELGKLFRLQGGRKILGT